MTTVEDLEPLLERHRAELTGYCYRMLGSSSEAEDAVQETLTRAWRKVDSFEGRSSVRTWMYRIASNVCFDMLRSSQRRARPMDLSGPHAPEPPAPGSGLLPETTWLQPAPDDAVLSTDPAERAVTRESVKLAFVAALQHLPPKQRAVLILRDVLRWHADEVAELLGTSVASVNSALQRARATMSARELSVGDAADPLDQAQQVFLERYLDAFERYDIDLLATLVHQDVIQSMPPYELWLQGWDDLATWWAGPGAACRGSRLVPTVANGTPAFGQYRPSGPGGRHEPWALQVLEIVDGRVAEFSFFLDTPTLFPMFGLPLSLD